MSGDYCPFIGQVCRVRTEASGSREPCEFFSPVYKKCIMSELAHQFVYIIRTIRSLRSEDGEDQSTLEKFIT